MIISLRFVSKLGPLTRTPKTLKRVAMRYSLPMYDMET